MTRKVIYIRAENEELLQHSINSFFAVSDSPRWRLISVYSTIAGAEVRYTAWLEYENT